MEKHIYMKDKSCYVDFDYMEQFMKDIFIALGVSDADAAICANVLITADKRGIDSHGLNRLKPIYYDRIKAGIQYPHSKLEVIRETATTAVLDGNHGMGHAIAYKSMQMAIEKAKKFGMGMVAVRNSTHYGIAGYYPLMAIEAGMIGFTGTNARPSVAPTFGVENMLGTNPLTIGFPTDEDFPFVLDCATSINQRGKIEVYNRLHKDTPAGAVIDNNGEVMTDSARILTALQDGTAALTPLGGIGEETGGYKGYGYCTVVEILSAALQQGQFMKMLSGFDKDGKRIPYGLGHFFMAIDTEAFMGLAEFKKSAGDILRALRNSKRMPGQNRIYTAGEKEHLAWLERKNKGVSITPSVQAELIQMRNELKLNQYKFPFEQKDN